MKRTVEEAEEAFIFFYTDQAATEAMKQIRENYATWKTSLAYSNNDDQKKHKK